MPGNAWYNKGVEGKHEALLFCQQTPAILERPRFPSTRDRQTGWRVFARVTMRPHADWRKDRFMKGKVKDMPGLYLIVNRINGRKYVGQSTNIKRRRDEHWGQLSNGNHCNHFLQSDYNEHGKDAFVFSVLEYFAGDQDALDKREQYWINKLCATYNVERDIAFSRAYHSSVDAMSVVVVGIGETYQRPPWHAWVYGGMKR